MHHLSLTLTLLLTLPLPAAPPSPGSLLPGGPAEWKLTWSDEFDGPDDALDQRWNSQNGPSGHILCSRWRENVQVENGLLKLINRKESRGGQDWTSGSISSKETFQYGYFECRYKYAAATGTNNSFWLMSPDWRPRRGKRFEIDTNEGHYPNEVNTNIHNWGDLKVVDGKKTHPTASRSFSYGQQPNHTIPLETPVTTRKLRFSSNHGSHFHIGEFRIFNVQPDGYPEITSDKVIPGLVDFAKDPGTKIEVSGFHDPRNSASVANLTDGKISTTWISQAEGEKWIEFTFPGNRTIGGIQFANGWRSPHGWINMPTDYKVQYHDGRAWVVMDTFDLENGEVNFGRDFHTFGLHWNEQEIAFYLDGRELRREKNEFCYSPSPVYLSLAIIAFAGQVTDAIDGTQMEVDYVRIYKPKEN